MDLPRVRNADEIEAEVIRLVLMCLVVLFCAAMYFASYSYVQMKKYEVEALKVADEKIREMRSLEQNQQAFERMIQQQQLQETWKKYYYQANPPKIEVDGSRESKK